MNRQPSNSSARRRRGAFTLPEAARIADGLRFAWKVWPLGEDILIDVALDRVKPEVCA